MLLTCVTSVSVYNTENLSVLDLSLRPNPTEMLATQANMLHLEM